ncbi:hypothetical protein C8R43DRAFT_871497, partial [Mycena crocata]
KAARSTSATPTLFKRIFGTGSLPETFIDAGMGRNNPADQVLSEARQMFPGRAIACRISIGT